MPNPPNRSEFEELTDTPRKSAPVPKGLRVPDVAVRATGGSTATPRVRKLGPTADAEEGVIEKEPEAGEEYTVDPDIDPAAIAGYSLPPNTLMCPTPYCRTLIKKPVGTSEMVECHSCLKTFDWSKLATTQKAPRFKHSRRIKTGMLVEIVFKQFSLVFALSPEAPQTIEAFKQSADSFKKVQAYPAYIKAVGGSASKIATENTSLKGADGSFKDGTLLWRENFFGILKQDARLGNEATALGTLIGGTTISRSERDPGSPPEVRDISVGKATEMLRRIETGLDIVSIRFEGVESAADKRFESRRPSYKVKIVNSSPAVAPRTIRDAVGKYAGKQAASEVIDDDGLSNLDEENIAYEFTHKIGEVLKYDPSKHRLSKTLNLTTTANLNDPVVVARHGILINPPGPCPQCKDQLIVRGKECERCKISSAELLAMPIVVKMSDLSRDIFTDDNVELWRRIDLSKLVRTFPKAASLLLDTPVGTNLELDTRISDSPYISRYEYLAYDANNQRWILLPANFGFARKTYNGLPLAVVPIYNVVDHPELLSTMKLLPIVSQGPETRYKTGDTAPVPTDDDFMTAKELDDLKNENVVGNIGEPSSRTFNRGGRAINVAYVPPVQVKPAVNARSWADIQKLVSTNSWYK